MKTKMNIRSIIILATICLASMFFINICFAANTGKISVETARLREQPNSDSKVLELASLNEDVEILEEQDGWYKVKYKNITGYLRKDLIEVQGEVTETAATETNTQAQSSEVNQTAEATQTTQPEQTTAENNSAATSAEPTTNTEGTQNNTTSETINVKSTYKVTSNIKIKIVPLINSLEVGEINAEGQVTVDEIINDWVKISTSDGKQGWIRKDKLVPTETQQETAPETTTTETQPEETTEPTSKTMYVSETTVNMRAQPDKTSEIVSQLSINTEVTVKSTESGWYQVEVNGQSGYIAEGLLSDTKQETSRSGITTREDTTPSSTEQQETSNTQNTQTTEITTSSTTGSEVVSYAQQFLGCRYVYGGTTTSGFDCSGFTQFVYKHFGVTLNRTAAGQYSNGTAVTSLQAGDLVMFGKSGINHVGIYIGGNRFIHAANPSRGVTTDTMASGYYKINYVGARRIF